MPFYLKEPMATSLKVIFVHHLTAASKIPLDAKFQSQQVAVKQTPEVRSDTSSDQGSPRRESYQL